ncbi:MULTISPECIES: hypothetical protein [Thermoactinomyces]|uniref:Uncharacterized protein n=1 Tax=Thermoactinomyces vulgaris TaxID=2026 RepID=A0ABS0QH44_THEVU|nr:MULTISPECIES: hypothetical protein [Thermoactinomyces]KFZ40417.1 hypothetical protein JS81_07940 [Thermoactinomyces sp. Gus2-1]KYQ86634.1 hypothetical protein AYX07_05655 [Thermoactinomyces sp. AS95]MBA4550843.1 hypothetical protein [Thermoactinomyces vulgaris]MBA4596098.1 hypothetical protein [Thermoactinomyces vulgaris]MBH8583166.1 hypothetical protein [Thermoactinomyces sp. CICC 10735]
MYHYPYGWMGNEGYIEQRRPEPPGRPGSPGQQQPPQQRPFVAPQTLRQYVGQVIRVVVRDVFRYPTYVYVADVNRWGDATLVACVQGVPRPIVVSSRQVSIV